MWLRSLYLNFGHNYADDLYRYLFTAEVQEGSAAMMNVED